MQVCNGHPPACTASAGATYGLDPSSRVGAPKHEQARERTDSARAAAEDEAGDETGLRGKWLPEDPTLRQKVHGDYTDQFPKPRLTGNHSAFRPCRAVLVFLSRQSIETRVHSKHAPRCEGADTVLEGHRTLREAVVLQKTSPAVIKGVSAWSSSRAFRSSRTAARLLDQPT